LDDDDSDDSEKEAEEPVVTEESRLTTEEYIPPVVVGQIFVKTLTGKTIAMSGITTWTTIIDIKRFIEESEGIPTKFQRLTYNGKKVKVYHTVGYYNIKREEELHMTGRLRGGGKRASSGNAKASKANNEDQESSKKLAMMTIEKGAKSFVATNVDENVLNLKEKLKHLTVSEIGKILRNELEKEFGIELDDAKRRNYCQPKCR